MSTTANFRVDPRLASLLGDGYRSTEHAIKELVDNAWDADAANVWIVLPAGMTDQPIIVRDDGAGMTDREIRSEYLAIASDRRTRKGERTPKNHRMVKGRKGIGKFAGLEAANVMDVHTVARGKETKLSITMEALRLNAKVDLESIPLPLEVRDCSDISAHGTTITLSQLSQKRTFPTPEALRELLVLDYGREQGFCIYVNDAILSHEDLRGESVSAAESLPSAGQVSVKVTVLEGKATRQPGIVLRVGGKVVGKPSFFGLDEREDIPRKLLNRVVGEVDAPGLEGDVTADWGAVITNSKAMSEVNEYVRKIIEPHIEKVFKVDIDNAKARLQREINTRLARLPEHRREYAREALDRAMRRFYGESEDRIAILVNLVLDAFEKDEYWLVCQQIEQADHSDVHRFAAAIEVFGLADMAAMAYQAKRRLDLLDHLDTLRQNPATLESEMHKAIEANLWLLGAQYTLLASNKTLASTVQTYCVAKFKGGRARKRPDLLLGQTLDRRYVLVEFKRPSEAVSRQHENQAAEYRDDLTTYFNNARIELVVMGGTINSKVNPLYSVSDSRLLTYADLLSNARAELDWLLTQLVASQAKDGAYV